MTASAAPTTSAVRRLSVTRRPGCTCDVIVGASLGRLDRLDPRAYLPVLDRTYVRFDGDREGRVVTKVYEELVTVERDAGMPSAFVWRGRRYDVRDVIGRWRIEGRWWEDGRDREYWRGGGEGGGGGGVYEDRPGGGGGLGG